MDSYWESIERDFEKHTQSRFTGLPTSSRDENKNMNVLNQLALPTPPPQALHTGISQHSMRQYAIENKETASSMHVGDDYLLHELAILRQSSKQQSEQMAAMEAMIIGQNKTSSYVQGDLLNRISILENEKLALTIPMSEGVNESSSQKTKREYDEMIFTRIAALENAGNSANAEENQVDNIGHVLGTTIDHLYTVSGVAEAARETSSRSTLLVEILLQAFCSLGNSESSSISLNYLSNLASLQAGGSHRDLLTGLIMDSLQTAIGSSVKSQMESATECLRDLFSPQIKSIQSKHDAAVDEVMTKMHEISVKVERSLSRVEERMTRLQSAHQLLIVETKTVVEDLQRAHDSDRELIASMSETQAMHSARLKSISNVEPRVARNTHDDNFTEQLKTITISLDSLLATQTTLQTSCDDSIFDFQNSLDKLKTLQREARSSIDSLSTSTKEEMMAVKQANQKMQLILEQQTGELYKRFSKLDAKLDKVEKKDKGGSSVVSDANIANITTELEGIRQSLANMIFDVDDLKTQLTQLDARMTKSQMRQNTHSEETGHQLLLQTGNIDALGIRVTHMQEAMDALQDEVVSLSATAVEQVSRSIDNEEDAEKLVEQASKKVQQRSALSQEMSTDIDAYMSSLGDDSFELEDEIVTGVTSESGHTPLAVGIPVTTDLDTSSNSKADIISSAVTENERGDDISSSDWKILVNTAELVTITGDLVREERDTEEKEAESISPTASNKVKVEELTKLSSGSNYSSSSSSSSQSGSDSDSDSFSSESTGDSDEEDIIGKYLPLTSTDEQVLSAKQDSGLSSSGPSPSEVLAEQLRLRANYEREQALKNVTAKRLSSMNAAPSGLSGPPLGAISGPGGAGAASNKPGSPKSILSGSLLSGRRNAGIAGNSGPGLRNSADSKPIFDTTFGEATTSESSATASTNAARRAAIAVLPVDKRDTLPVDKRDTIQCSHCLRRISRLEMVTHNASCELRTDLCPNGCGAKVRAIKLDIHLKECPKK